MIEIRYEPSSLVLRIPRSLAAAQYVQEFLERVRVDTLLAASAADDDAIDALAEAVNAEWWAANRERLLGGLQD